MEKIRKGDEVVVIAGRDKGKRASVLSRVDETHLLVEGVNLVKKHQRPNPMKGLTGGIVEKTMPIDQSNVMVPVPPVPPAVAEPVLLPHPDGLLPVMIAVGAPGWVMVTLPVAAQPLASVTVTPCTPGGRFVAVCVVWLFALTLHK